MVGLGITKPGSRPSKSVVGAGLMRQDKSPITVALPAPGMTNPWNWREPWTGGSVVPSDTTTTGVP